jgi:hypothetical protein
MAARRQEWEMLILGDKHRGSAIDIAWWSHRNFVSKLWMIEVSMKHSITPAAGQQQRLIDWVYRLTSIWSSSVAVAVVESLSSTQLPSRSTSTSRYNPATTTRRVFLNKISLFLPAKSRAMNAARALSFAFRLLFCTENCFRLGRFFCPLAIGLGFCCARFSHWFACALENYTRKIFFPLERAAVSHQKHKKSTFFIAYIDWMSKLAEFIFFPLSTVALPRELSVYSLFNHSFVRGFFHL